MKTGADATKPEVMDILIRKGTHYQKSLCRLVARFWPKKFRVGMEMDFSFTIVSPPYRIPTDTDDRHKAIGANLQVFKESNNNSIMLSFQSNPDAGGWDLAFYANEDKDWDTSSEYTSMPGERVNGKIKWVAENKVVCHLYDDNGTEVVSWEYEWENLKPKRWGWILTYHGGYDNDGDGYGGVAPVDLRFRLEYSMK